MVGILKDSLTIGIIENHFPIEKGAIVAVIVWWLDLQLPMQSVPVTTDVMSSNLDLGNYETIGSGVRLESTS
jgi:hypothetical protein